MTSSLDRQSEQFRIGKQRSPFVIMRQLLVRIQSNNRTGIQSDSSAQPLVKRELMRDVNLNYAQLNRHLDLLEEHGLVSITESDEGLTVTVTQTGELFIEKTGRLVEFLSSDSPDS